MQARPSAEATGLACTHVRWHKTIKMKTTSILLFLILLTGYCLGQTKKVDDYFPLYEVSNTAKYFKMSNGSYLDYFPGNKVNYENNEYYAKVRIYSWGKSDTTYYREDEKGYYHFNPKTNNESVVLPKEVKIGLKWLEADSSWSYEIIGVNEKLETPLKKYKGLIVIECTQLTGRDKEKSKVYHMYYAHGIGMVGSMNNGILTSYLAEVRKNAKEGDRIGN